jgi:hypothetical protein
MSLLLDSESASEEIRAPIHENASRVVWTLAWPAVALNSLQVINTLLDRGFIGHLPTAAQRFDEGHGGDLLLCPREGGPRGSQQLELEGRQGRQGLVSTMSISLDLDVLETVPLADQT